MSNSAFYAGKNWCRVAFTISIFATVAMLGSTAYAATLVAGGRAALPAPASGTIPVDHFLLYPNFRGMLFDDKPQTIQDTVEMNTVSYPGGAIVKATLETMGGSVLATQSTPFSTTNTTITFDGTSLVDGSTYNLYVRLYDGSGTLLYTQTPYVISKMTGSLRTGMKFFIDENNHAWVRGAEVFPLGMYDSNFTLVNSSNIGSYQEYPNEFSQPFDMYLNFYQSDPGLSVANSTGQLINSKNGANWMGTDTGITCGGSTAATPASYFSSYASSQYTLGYYLIDEPGTDCVPGMFQTTKNNAAGDPASFSWPALNGNNNTNFGAPTASNLSFYKQFRDTFDIAGSDPYPNFNCTTEFCQAQYNIGDQTAQLNQAVYNARPNWMVMQYFMFNVLGAGHWPTQKELRSSAYMALTDGATGLFWWDMGNSPDASMPSWNDLLVSNPAQAQQEWTWLKGVMAEVKGLQTPLLAPNAAAVGVSGVSAGTIHTMTKQVGNQFYVFAYNHTANSVTPTFTLPISASGNVTVYNEGRTITPSGSTFTDTFTTYAPHVYVITTGGGALVTSDSLLNTGNAVTISQNNSGQGGAINVTSKTGSNVLWQLVPSAWAVNSGSVGNSTVSYTGTGSVTMSVNYSSMSPSNSGVNGYPFLFYGGDQWGSQIGGQPPQFPAQLSSMSSLVVDTTYALSGTKYPGDTDVLYDEWLIPTKTYTGGSGGALEVEVIPYFNFAFGTACSVVKTFTEPMTINGTASSMSFSENFCGPGPGGDVLFYPTSPTNGYLSAEVRFNMLDFLNEAANTAGLSGWWVSGMEFGTEFGDASSLNYSMNVTKMDIEQAMAGGSDTTPPTASITSPTNGSSFAVGTSIPVNVSASDNIGVVKSEFYVDGTLLATSLSSPWGFTWNTTGASATTHTLTVKAYDAANNVGTSAGVSITLTTTASLSASASASPTSGVAPLAVNFTGSASGGTSPYTYSWNFGDGSAASTAQNPPPHLRHGRYLHRNAYGE